MTNPRTEDDFRRRLAELRADAQTRLEDLNEVAQAAGLVLKTNRRGSFSAVPAACHPTIARIRAAMLRSDK